MNGTKTSWWMPGAALAVVVGVALVIAQVTPSRAQPGPKPGGTQGQPLAELSGDAFDQAFLREMVMHHAMAVMMARPVAESAPHQELRDQAAAIIADQTREIGEMRRWLREWYGIELPDPLAMMAQAGASGMEMPMMPGMDMSGGHPGTGSMHNPMHGSGMAMMSGMGMMDLAHLPPARMEVVFMSMMIVHHEGAITMAGLAGDRAAHDDLRGLAQDIITSQSAEIDHFNHWLQEWYGL